MATGGDDFLRQGERAAQELAGLGRFETQPPKEQNRHHRPWEELALLKEIAQEEFAQETISEAELWEKYQGKVPNNRVVIKDRIADAMFQQVLLRPTEYSVVATTNLNGDYISDALAAQVGGLGMAPGANMGDHIGFFEATHGTAPKYAGQDKVNPSSLILSGEMMLRYMGWDQAAELIIKGIEKTIQNKTVTYDLERQMDGAKLLKCSEYGAAIVENM